MSKQRRPHGADRPQPQKGGKSTTAEPAVKKQAAEEQEGNQRLSTKTLLTFACIGIACCIGYKGYLETRVNTQFDNKKVVLKSGLAIPERYWGSYRPGNYFGLKTREPYSPVMGLMWYFPNNLRPNGEGIRYIGSLSAFRHWCEQGDNLERYTWTQHDGKMFGVQEIEDGMFNITTSFVKSVGGTHGGDWTTRITVNPKGNVGSGETVNLLFYMAIESQTKGRISPTHTGMITGVVGETQELGPFALRLFNISGDIQYQSYLSVETKGLHLLKETVISTLRLITMKGNKMKHIVLPGDLTKFKDQSVSPNFIATQVEGKVPFTIDAVFESGSFIDRPNTLTGDTFLLELKKHKEAFHQKFEETFHLKEKNYNEDYINFAEAAFSNLIGGIGYFYGSSRVISDHTKSPVPYWKAPLLTAVPSRSFFPRGFLWDEGFHGLLISAWDLDLELDIMSHWFDLMNIEGWIPREQILGQEALAKVPEEFVTQTNNNANPPTFFLTLRFIIQNFWERMTEEDRLGALERMYPRLVAWFDWFNSTQTGPVPGSYRWRGRDANTQRELNPKTMTSGLDDYPRASHPTQEERHLDLRCWIMLGAATLAEIAKLLNRAGNKYMDTYSFLYDNRLLDSLHWSEEMARYADYGLHTDDVALKRPPPPPHPPQPSRPLDQEIKRVVLTDPRLRFIDSTFGYVSLFPFFIHSLNSNSPKLQKLMTDLRNPQLLWTDYGLRSLSRNSPLYLKRNTEHDPPYWRGPIWINMNYLALEALHFYSKLPGPFQGQANDLYEQLRKNVITNIYKQYKRTGYIWEQYNDKTGEGQGSRPFTGWSSLVVLLMAEMY